MATIYGLFTDQLCWYVGSTINVKRREHEHRHKARKGFASDLIPLEYEWEFRVIEECALMVRLQRERHWHENLKPLCNKYMPSRPHTERMRLWRLKNKSEK